MRYSVGLGFSGWQVTGDRYRAVPKKLINCEYQCRSRESKYEVQVGAEVGASASERLTGFENGVYMDGFLRGRGTDLE